MRDSDDRKETARDGEKVNHVTGTSISDLVIQMIEDEINSIIRDALGNGQAYGLAPSEVDTIKVGLLDPILKDLSWIYRKDPAALSDHMVHDSYSGFSAIRSYRMAHCIYQYALSLEEEEIQEIQYEDSLSGERAPIAPLSALLKRKARKISEDAKVKTGIEIHPAAQIGVPFAIDHGWNTVIGETAEIGRFCYFLQAVLLGGRGIAGNPEGRRHPTIGDYVELAGAVQIIGPVEIGDRVIIEPGAKISRDIVSDSVVSSVSTALVTKRKEQADTSPTPVIYGLVPGASDKELVLYGKNIFGLEPRFCYNMDQKFSDYCPIADSYAGLYPALCDVSVEETTGMYTRFSFKNLVAESFDELFVRLGIDVNTSPIHDGLGPDQVGLVSPVPPKGGDVQTPKPTPRLRLCLGLFGRLDEEENRADTLICTISNAPILAEIVISAGAER